MSELQAIPASISLHTTPTTSNKRVNSSRVTLDGRNALAGAAGGTVAVLLGQPFDLIRVRLQTTNSSNVLGTAKNIWIREGPSAFYKGATTPLLGGGLTVSIQFLTYHSARKSLERSFGQNQLSKPAKEYLAGFTAGAANSSISGPIEHIRTRLQLQPHGAARLYAGPWDCIRQIVAKAGIRGIFKAMPIHFVKECQAFGCYFTAYELSIDQLTKLRNKKRSELTMLETTPCGALGGIAFWLGSFPIDMIKTKMVNDGFGAEAKYRNTWAAVVETWRKGGIVNFWRGLSPTLVRTSLSSAGCFATVEQVRKWLHVNNANLD